jgi:deferrochelatase/peroxidase EfeB
MSAPKGNYHAHKSTLDLDDIQGNILRGYKQRNGRHFALRVVNGGSARGFLGDIVDPDSKLPQVTTAAHWGDDRPPYCLNIGITHAGLAALGIPKSMLEQFPKPFSQGPAARASEVGDEGPSDPQLWSVGGPGTPPVHVVLSLYTTEETNPQQGPLSQQLREAFGESGLDEIWSLDTNAFPDGKIHFGYRDGISQPNVEGAPGGRLKDMQPDSLTGDFLLGKNYRNLYKGNYIGGIPPELGDNASYAAVRVLDQHVEDFENFINTVEKRHHMDSEMVAAKMVGRWRNGNPLVLTPHRPDPDPEIPWDNIDKYDYAPSDRAPEYLDDKDGMRCPIGSHMRRLNPRSSLVMGSPHSRRIIRRGMPYGPQFDPKEPVKAERGLFGYFICGDLAMQYEFLMGTWANGDFSTSGLRGTRDPILGAQPEEGGQFVIRTEDVRDPIVVDDMPRLVTTRGSLYCFLPGLNGLRFIAGKELVR